MGRKERAKERRENRMQEISQLRKIPYTDQQRWWCSETIAVVTGANRGIGFEIARQLAVLGLTVVFTSRDLDKLNEATKPLLEQGLSVVTHQLDILSQESVQLFADWISRVYGGLDILVNNAGVNFNIGSDNSVEFAETVINTNYYGTKRMIKAMIPLMKCSTYASRIVNVSSRLGRLNGRRNVGSSTMQVPSNGINILITTKKSLWSLISTDQHVIDLITDLSAPNLITDLSAPIKRN
ncbi:hypothetical protein AQUCO_04500189v1 [Aquilegia coerulea]|uniref:Uncharacterized protein n=1 Tax=Aquilegia coerulea TaxID=218851 RepID=A0A2G5CM97_AQUCA|nr:hypothetical protein AQUCO_04500189v1 [Aquilegia coerulea]